MDMRPFGRTGLRLSVLGFGCGAVGGLMVRGAPADQERAIARAIDAGVNYFDTAWQYGEGELEKNLGRILQALKPADAIVGTKVRLQPDELGRIGDAIVQSLEASLRRLRLERVDILHLHNGDHHERRRQGLQRRAGARRSGAGDGAAAPRRQAALPRPDRRRRHGRAPSGDRCRRLRQRADRLQHAQSVGRGRAAGELSGAGLRPAARSHHDGRDRRHRHPRARRRGAVRLGRAPSGREPAARADRIGHELRRRRGARPPADAAGRRRDLPRT